EQARDQRAAGVQSDDARAGAGRIGDDRIAVDCQVAVEHQRVGAQVGHGGRIAGHDQCRARADVDVGEVDGDARDLVKRRVAAPGDVEIVGVVGSGGGDFERRGGSGGEVDRVDQREPAGIEGGIGEHFDVALPTDRGDEEAARAVV